MDEEGQIRATPGGYWEVYKDNVGIYKVIGFCANKLIGFKTKLIFHDNNANGNLTDWEMIQFRCHPSRIPTTTHTVSILVHDYLHIN